MGSSFYTPSSKAEEQGSTFAINSTESVVEESPSLLKEESSLKGANSLRGENSLKEKWGLIPSAHLGFWEKDKSLSQHRDYLSTSLWLILDPQISDALPFYFEGFIQAQEQSKYSPQLSSFEKKLVSYSEIREWYWKKSFSTFDLRVGRQINVWGRADKTNPTDVLTVKNMQFMSTNDEEQRLGLFSTMLTYHLASSKMIALWQPEWRSPTYPFPTIAGIHIQELKPQNTAAQFGLKWDYSGEGFDGSVSYFNGFAKTPDIRLSSTAILNPSSIDVELNYAEIQMLGADFALNVGETAVRGELAYTQTEDKNGDDPWVSNPQLFAVLGADRLLFENFNLNLQVLYKYIEHFSSFDDPQLQPLIDVENRISQQQFKTQWGWSLRPSYKLWNESLEIEAGILYWERTKEKVIRPKITYSLHDQSKLIVGAEIFDGPALSLFGSFKNLSGGFAEWRYYF